MTDFLEKAVLQGFEGSVHLDNNILDTNFPMSLNFATLLKRKGIENEFFI
jgi:hypothetical protein